MEGLDLERFVEKALLPASLGLLLTVIWVPVGIITYMNHLAGPYGTKYMLYLVFGLPLFLVVLGIVLLRKKLWFRLISWSFLISTMLLCLLIPVLLEA